MSFVKSLSLLVLAPLAVAQSASQEPLFEAGNDASDNCHNACTALTAALGSKAYYNSVPEGFTEGYFSARQREVNPACIIQPESPQDVSEVIVIVKQYQCKFAVKSGGHAMFAGGSNIDGGVTIDLVKLNQVDVSKDLQTASIGPGNRWGRVYEILEPMGLTVAGGRISNVGVGGFMLGGGISYISRKHGWASDNVRNYELVLANGSITNVNYASYPDLYWALRGGGNQFGVVTRFDLETFPQKEIWGGQNLYAFSDFPALQARLKISQSTTFSLQTVRNLFGRSVVSLLCAIGKCVSTTDYLDALEKMVIKGDNDEPYLHLYMSFGYLPSYNTLLATSCVVHIKPEVNPTAFSDILKLFPAHTSVKIKNLTDVAKDIDVYNTPGYRHTYAPMTFKMNKELLSQVLDFFVEASDTVKDISGIAPSFVCQPLTQISKVNKHKNGGNPFGLEEADGPLIMISISPSWNNAEDDLAVFTAFRGFMDKSIALAKKMNLHHPFIYQNYANISQDVFAGYGKENRQKLLDIQGKYDPERMFNKLQPGYFRL